MVWRAEFGQRGSQFGCWVSKPGIDVTTASPGDFLVNTSSQVFQCVWAGDQVLGTEGSATIAAGTVWTAPVTLPAAFASYSNLMVHATYYMAATDGTYYPTPTSTYMTWRTTSGTLIFNVTFRLAGGTGGPISFIHHASYTVFRGQF